MSVPILEMKNITKEFPGVKALDDVSFQVARDEIHCLVGENGAGKSTLMKVLSGVHPDGSYTGEINFDGEKQSFRNTHDSEKAGIAIIYQELALVPEMTVFENVFLGHEIRTGLTVDENETIQRTLDVLGRVRLDVNPSTKVRDLGVGKQQLVEIAKALSRDVKLLILDEPTSALNEDDSENLLQLLRELKTHGVTCILISHKLKEVISIADKVTILRDGKSVCTLNGSNGEINENVLIKHMVGREIENIYPKRERKASKEVVFEVKNWNAYDPKRGRMILNDVDFKLHRGEIIGFAGLMGSGRTELALSLFGNPDGYKIDGDMYIKGKQVSFNHTQNAIKAGLAYVTEDRKGDGLILIQDVKENITLANLREISKNGVVDYNAEIVVAQEYTDSLNIKTPSIEQRVENLSGGNQQKVSLAKWLYVKPDIMILDEPTRGIDVGAKYEIYTIMNRLVEQGMSIIMISSELPEILGMSDRIYIVSTGRITGELPIEKANQEEIMRLATD
ncbi:MAG: ATP-binding cassette domain-containing protein [Anaerolineaceae bacterium]|nr:ATP-binding cassette domain-containing protein [Anaerolineaceae bacterium]